jgi:hypothetical protein
MIVRFSAPYAEFIGAKNRVKRGQFTLGHSNAIAPLMLAFLSRFGTQAADKRGCA